MNPTALALLALAVATQQIPQEPAKDLFLHFLKVPGIEVRFVDYHLQPALFDAMKKGTHRPRGQAELGDRAHQSSISAR